MDFFIPWFIGFLIIFFVGLVVTKLLEKLKWFSDIEYENRDLADDATWFSLFYSLMWPITVPLTLFVASVFLIYKGLSYLATKLADKAFKKIKGKQEKA